MFLLCFPTLYQNCFILSVSPILNEIILECPDFISNNKAIELQSSTILPFHYWFRYIRSILADFWPEIDIVWSSMVFFHLQAQPTIRQREHTRRYILGARYYDMRYGMKSGRGFPGFSGDGADITLSHGRVHWLLVVRLRSLPQCSVASVVICELWT